MKRIQQLPENLINQIAAGEAIERPASVVKELVENSIDAGATRVEVEISNESRDIRVADNGHGIHKDDILLAFSRHATSKITEQKDLWKLYTLGFRGEALSSIISVAKVTCITKTPSSDVGVKVTCENSQINFSETGCAVGTTMEINDLFYNVPARLKFLKKAQTELSAISEVVQNIALSNPGVALNLIHKKNSIFKTTGSDDLATVIGEVYSKEIISELSEVYKEDEQFGIKISGYTSQPDFTRSNKKAIHTFINGRTVKCPVISKAIDTAYKDLIPSGKFPYAVLNLSIKPKEVDVNVHPAKREVRYTNPNLIFNFIYSAVKVAVKNDEIASLPTVARNDDKVIEFSRPALALDMQAPVEVEEIEKQDIKEVSYTPPQPVQNKFEFKEEDLDLFAEKPKIIGQFDNTYILIQKEDGLQVIDQHIAHERYLYEKLKKDKTVVSQLLLTSKTIEVTSEQLGVLEENTSLLAKYGYELDIEGLGIKLKRIPQMVIEKDPQKIVNDLIEAFESSPDTIENELLMRTACLASVKAGEKLSLWEMEELIINWQKTSYPKTCPHGRKIAHTISKQEIAGFFGRQLQKL